MDPLRTIALTIFCFGAFAFGTICWYALRDPNWRSWGRHTSGPALGGLAARVGPMAMCLLSFAWFVVLVARQLLVEAPHDVRAPFLYAFAVMALLYPGLIMMLTYWETRLARPDRLTGIGWRLPYHLILLLTWGEAALIGLRLAGWNPLGDNLVFRLVSWVLAIGFGSAAIYGIVVMTSDRGTAAATPTGRRSMVRWTVGLYGLMCITVISMATWGPTDHGVGEIFNILGPSMPLLFVFVGIWEDSRFEFFDLFVKRGAALSITLALFVGYFSLAVPWIASLPLGAATAWGQAIGLLPAAMLLPWVNARIGRWLDARLLGRGYTGTGAITPFLAELGQATDEKGLVESAERGLRRIFDAPAKVELGASSQTDDDDGARDGGGETSGSVDGKAEAESGCESGWVQRVPLRAGEAGEMGQLLLGQRRNEVPYFSEDLSLVSSLSDVLGYMLQNVRLQQRAREQSQQAKELSLQASRSELKALRAQINPHFLFNALNAIAGLIHRDPDAADRTVEQLADVFRYTLRGSTEEWARLEDELEFVEAYLAVERARFGSRLSVTIEVAPELRGAMIPTMVLQTLVENAVKHGVARMRGEATIEVTGRREADGRLRLEVRDNGPGLAASAERARVRGEGHGLHSVRERLDGHFGGRARLELTRDETTARTVASLLLPLREERVDAPTRGAQSG